MHLSMWVASSLSTYVIPVLFNKNSSANISRSPFIKLIIYSTRFVIIKTFIKKIFASTEIILGNSKALNALFNGVDKSMFRLIKQCTVAKDAWEILKTAHEGTTKVKSAKLQLLTTKFENAGG